MLQCIGHKKYKFSNVTFCDLISWTILKLSYLKLNKKNIFDKLNKLIQEYFYNLNKNKGYQYSEYVKNKDREKGYITCIDDLPDDEKEFYDMHHVKDYQGISDKIQKERDDCVKKYIELKDYMDTIQNGVRGIVIPIKN